MSRTATPPTRAPFQVPETVHQRLASISRPVSAPKGQIVFQRGDNMRGIYIVESGRVALIAGEAPHALRRICERGSVLGLPATMRNKPYSLTAQSLTEAELSFVEREDFVNFLKNEPTLCMEIVQVLAEEVGSLRRSAIGPMKKRAAANRRAPRKHVH